MNKMTEAEIHEVLDFVREGDVVRAVFEGEAGKDKRYPLWLTIADKTLRYQDSTFNEALISVENLGQPEQYEPVKSSFALLEDDEIVKTAPFVGWISLTKHNTSYAWNQIKPRIKTLYNPDGSISESWN